jgi:hypothetical protein
VSHANARREHAEGLTRACWKSPGTDASAIVNRFMESDTRFFLPQSSAILWVAMSLTRDAFARIGALERFQEKLVPAKAGMDAGFPSKTRQHKNREPFRDFE